MRDIDIRRKLRRDDRLHPGDPNTRVIEELGLCRGVSRVDIAVVNGSIHGYEIKSEHDTLARLPGQQNVYNQVLDYVTIVTAPSHAEKVSKAIPLWWGIWSVSSAEGDIQINEVRKGLRNPEVKAFALVQLLWRDEALDVLTEKGMIVGMRGKPREILWNRLASSLPIEELAMIVRERLKRRSSSWRPLAQPD